MKENKMNTFTMLDDDGVETTYDVLFLDLSVVEFLA